jgi:hypothetical protein
LATFTIADRSMPSVLSVGCACAACLSASSRIWVIGGAAGSGVEPGTNEKPVMAPPAPRLTSAAACCHRGLLAGVTRSPHLGRLGLRNGWDGERPGS